MYLPVLGSMFFFSTIFLRSKVGFPRAAPLVGGRETQMISKGLLVFGDIEVAEQKDMFGMCIQY